MHVSRKEDKGGNTIQVRFDNNGTNLHSLWDSKLIDHQGLSASEMATQYDRAKPEQIKQWQQDQPMQWLWESYQISTQLYAEVEKNNTIDEDYYKNHIGIIEKRIDQAGIRLAGLLNEIYSHKENSYTSALPILPESKSQTPNPATSNSSIKRLTLRMLPIT